MPARYTALAFLYITLLSGPLIPILIGCLGLFLYGLQFPGEFDYFPKLLWPIKILLFSLPMIWFIRALRSASTWRGVLITEDRFPFLVNMVRECAATANVEEPHAIYVTPDANLVSYCVGRFRTHSDHESFISVGLLLLFCLNIEDLRVAMTHELGHIFIRRSLWCVSIVNTVRGFTIPVLRRIRAIVNGLLFTPIKTFRDFKVQFGSALSILFGFLFLVCLVFFLWVGLLALLVIYLTWQINWWLACALHAPIMRQEELLADDLAKITYGNERFSASLIRTVLTQRSLAEVTRGDQTLTATVNTQFISNSELFHPWNESFQARKRSPEAEFQDDSNWFKIVRRHMSDYHNAYREHSELELNHIRRLLESKEREIVPMFSSHPSLLSRMCVSEIGSLTHCFVADDKPKFDYLTEGEELALSKDIATYLKRYGTRRPGSVYVLNEDEI